MLLPTSTDTEDSQVQEELANASAGWEGAPTAFGILRRSLQIVFRNPAVFLVLFAISAGGILLTDWLRPDYQFISEDSPFAPLAGLIEPVSWISYLVSCTVFILAMQASIPVYFCNTTNPSMPLAHLRPHYGPAFLVSLALYVLPELVSAVGFFPDIITIILTIILMPFALFVLLKLSFLALIMAFEHRSVIDALKLSWERTAGYSWAIFRFICLILVPFGSFVLYQTVTLVQNASEFEQQTFPMIPMALFTATMEVLGTVGTFWLYFEQRFGRIPDHSRTLVPTESAA